MTDSIPMFVIIWCSFALFCGGLLKGTLGVGTPLLTVPMMALVLPAQSAVALMAMPVVAANLWQAWRAPDIKSTIGRFWPAAVALLLGTLIGTRILSVIDERLLLFAVFSIQAAAQGAFDCTGGVDIRHVVGTNWRYLLHVRPYAYYLPGVYSRPQ